MTLKGNHPHPALPGTEQPRSPRLHTDSSLCQHPASPGFVLGGQKLGMRQSRNDAEPPTAGPHSCFVMPWNKPFQNGMNLSWPCLGEAAEPHTHLTTPGHFWPLPAGFSRAVVSHLSATASTVEESSQEMGTHGPVLPLGTAAQEVPFPLIPGAVGSPPDQLQDFMC